MTDIALRQAAPVATVAHVGRRAKEIDTYLTEEEQS